MIAALLARLGFHCPEPPPPVKKKSSTLLRLQTQACRAAVSYETRKAPTKLTIQLAGPTRFKQASTLAGR